MVEGEFQLSSLGKNPGKIKVNSGDVDFFV